MKKKRQFAVGTGELRNSEIIQRHVDTVAARAATWPFSLPFAHLLPPFSHAHYTARRYAYDVATGSMTAVYERSRENIRSSRRSNATVNFRPHCFGRERRRRPRTDGRAIPVQGARGEPTPRPAIHPRRRRYDARD